MSPRAGFFDHRGARATLRAMADTPHPRSHKGARGNAPGSVPGLVKAHQGAVPLRLDIIAYGPDGAMRERDVSVARVTEINLPTIWVSSW